MWWLRVDHASSVMSVVCYKPQQLSMYCTQLALAHPKKEHSSFTCSTPYLRAVIPHNIPIVDWSMKMEWLETYVLSPILYYLLLTGCSYCYSSHCTLFKQISWNTTTDSGSDAEDLQLLSYGTVTAIAITAVLQGRRSRSGRPGGCRTNILGSRGRGTPWKAKTLACM